ncbi:DUF6327 family protein [Flavobacterium frigidarium]|jgi:hypothetical protein|uniref:DUF6327 family protein n=1 Tax=Flavobacterium frigidarium TaxID=99286 RepID=UPI000405B127|nr:DUF6327 family protein [Flavobacterium frigidarium]
MAHKIYTSYNQIDKELEILNLEKEVSYQRVILSLKNTKESLAPTYLISNVFSSFKTGIRGSYVQILNSAIPLIINWIINKKRGR